MQVVVVESPAKARTIEKYLGGDYAVLASNGHVRDLLKKDGSVKPDNDFEMIYETDERARKPLRAIASALGKADGLILATDPDREGEAISWHVLNWLKEKKALGERSVKRVVFHEITQDAVREAMARPRDIDMNLVNAQQARRALDYLVGFNLSPVLWRKLPGSRSAGRVQSVALRLICEREAEIETFVPREYWTVEADLAKRNGIGLSARLAGLDGNRLDKFDLETRARADEAAERIRAGSFAVASVERKQVRRNPKPPFTTSTLQQEASRKLGFGAKRTMRAAQRLYEGVAIGGETTGLITYMRTDSVTLAGTAISQARRHILEDFGKDYLPENPRMFRSTARNAQEAHEAIRPTGFDRSPQDMARHLGSDEARLYELIWKRATASQMTPAVFDRVQADIATEPGDVVLRATGQVMVFDGFMKLYREDRDDPDENDGDGDRRLPELEEGEHLEVGEVRPEQHFTEPPPRLTEASLVKQLEELGIGRPSTYAAIIDVLQKRNYVALEGKRFVPTDGGRLVTAFLEVFFGTYVEYEFTADLEKDLDRISNGDIDWKQVLREFWTAFHAVVEEAGTLERQGILAEIENLLDHHIFRCRGDDDPRVCPSCEDGRLGLRLGRNGAFIGCANYPECRFTRPFITSGDEQAREGNGPQQLGTDPDTDLAVTLRNGPHGLYIQKGEAGDDNNTKPPRVSVPRNTPPDRITLELALGLLALPREVGTHPESGKPVLAGIGRFGPYLKHDNGFVSIPGDDDVLTIGLNRAVTLIAEKGVRRGNKVLRELGEHPEDGGPIEIREGRYGPYVAHKGLNASLPKDTEPDDVTLEAALELLRKKAAKKGTRKAAPKKKAKTTRKRTRKAAPKRKGTTGAGTSGTAAGGSADS